MKYAKLSGPKIRWILVLYTHDQKRSISEGPGKFMHFYVDNGSDEVKLSWRWHTLPFRVKTFLWCTVAGASPRLKHPVAVALFSALSPSPSRTFCDHENGTRKRQMVLGTLLSGEAAKGRVCELPHLKVWPASFCSPALDNLTDNSSTRLLNFSTTSCWLLNGSVKQRFLSVSAAHDGSQDQPQIQMKSRLRTQRVEGFRRGGTIRFTRLHAWWVIWICWSWL